MTVEKFAIHVAALVVRAKAEGVTAQEQITVLKIISDALKQTRQLTGRYVNRAPDHDAAMRS
jgi:hypothetical protein